MKIINKTCTLYIVRHGETDWNVKQIIQGHSDSKLTKHGKTQVVALAKNLQHIHFDALFSSNLLRTKQTAEILNIERKLAIQTTNAIRERAFGKYEGRTADSFYEEVKDLIEQFKTMTIASKRKFKYPTTESDEEMIGRIFTFLREISVAYLGKKVLVVSHGGVIRNLLLHLGYGTYDNLPMGTISNAAYVVLESDGVDFFVKETVGIQIG